MFFSIHSRFCRKLLSNYAPIKSKLQHPPSWANSGHLTIFCARGGEFDLCLGGVGKFKRKCHVSFLFSGAEVALKTCLDEMEEFKGREKAFVRDWVTKKVFKSCLQRKVVKGILAA